MYIMQRIHFSHIFTAKGIDQVIFIKFIILSLLQKGMAAGISEAIVSGK